MLDLRSVAYAESSAAELLLDFHDAVERDGVDVRIARANRPLREQLLALSAGRRLSAERFFESASAAVDDFLDPPPAS